MKVRQILRSNESHTYSFDMRAHTTLFHQNLPLLSKKAHHSTCQFGREKLRPTKKENKIVVTLIARLMTHHHHHHQGCCEFCVNLNLVFLIAFLTTYII